MKFEIELTPYYAARLVKDLREENWHGPAGQIEKQLPTSEPAYAGAKVRAHLGPNNEAVFLKIVTYNEFCWASMNTGSLYAWAALTNPTLISEGVQQ